MLAHDYRWLGGSIKQALRDDHEAARHIGSVQRSFTRIEEENQVRAIREKKAAKEAAAALGGKPLEAGKDGAISSSTSLIPSDGDKPTSSTGSPTLGSVSAAVTAHQMKVNKITDGTIDVDTAALNGLVGVTSESDPLYRLSHLIDPSSFFPPDLERPFTAVHLVALKQQQDWSAIKKRATMIAETRRKQLSHAYQTNDLVAGQSAVQQKAFLKRQARQDRKRMKQHDREKRAAEREKLQKLSSMKLSPPATDSEDDTSSDDEDDDPMLRGGVLAGYFGRASNKSRRPEDDDEEDGPPQDAEEIQMRMARAAWRRTRDIIGRTLQQLGGSISQPIGKSPTAGGSRSMPPVAATPQKRNHRAQSIIFSHDSRVQDVYAQINDDLKKKQAKEEKEQVSLDQLKYKKEMEKRDKEAQWRRIKEQKGRHRRSFTIEKEIFNKSDAAIFGGSRLMDRSQSSASLTHQPETTATSPSHRRSLSPKNISRSQSAMSLIEPRAESPSRSQSSLSRTDSAPVLTVGGHIIRPSKTSTVSTNPAVASSPSPSLEEQQQSSLTSPTPTSTDQPASGSFGGINFNTPMMARRRARQISPLPNGGPGASLSPIAATTTPPQSSTADEEGDSNTFLTQPRSSPSAATPVFSVPEYASPSPSVPPFTGMLFPQRHARAALPQVTNVLSPVQVSIPLPSQRPGDLHSLRSNAPIEEEHRPTILQPISSIARGYTSNPLQSINTALVAKPTKETQKIMRQLHANLAATDAEVSSLLTPEQQLKSRLAELALTNDDPFSYLRATAQTNTDTPRLTYSRTRAEKSDLASKIMMSFSHEDMENISKEIVRNGGEMTCADFIRTTRRKQQGDQDYAAENEALAEMFHEIDVNNDGTLSFLEFTSYLVELAHTQYQGKEGSELPGASSLTGGNSEDPARLDFTTYQSLEDQIVVQNDDEIDFTFIKWFDAIDSFIVLEKNQMRFKVLDKSLRLTKIVRGHTMPIVAIEYLPFHQLLVTSSLDRTMKFWSCNWDKDGREKEYEELIKGLATGKVVLKDSDQTSSVQPAQTPPSKSRDNAMLRKLQKLGNGRESMKFQGSPPLSPSNKKMGDLGHLGMPGYSNAPLSQSGLTAAIPNAQLLASAYQAHSRRRSPPVPTYAEIASWNTPLPQLCLLWNKTRLYSSDSTGRIIAWNVDSGDTRASLMGHQGNVNTMISIPEMLASASDDTTVRLWDNTHGTEVACLRKHQRPIHSLCFTHNQNLLASGGDDDFIRLWDINSHKHITSFYFDSSWFKTLPGHDSDSVCSMDVLDHELIVGSRRGTFHVYDLRMMSLLQTFQLPDVDEENMNEAALDAAEDATKPRKKKGGVVAGGHPSALGAIDHDDEDEIETELERMRRRGKISLKSFCVYKDDALLEAHAAQVKELQRERDEERARVIEVAQANGEVLPPEQPQPVDLPKDPRCQLIIAAGGRHIHRFGKGGSITRNISHDDPVIFAEFNPSSLTIFTVSAKQVKTWCCITGRLIKSYTDFLMKESRGRGIVMITSACLDQRKRKFILGDNVGNIYIFNYNTGSLMHKLSNTALPTAQNVTRGTEVLNLHCITNISYHAGMEQPNISINFVHSIANSIHIHVDDPDHMPENDSSNDPISKNSKKLPDGSIQARTVLHSLTAHKQDISCIAISEKFRMILSGSADGSIVCYPWELAGSPTQRLIPGEILQSIAGSFQGQAFNLDAFKTPILSVLILHPYKILACSDSLGHIFFYYFNKDKHQLIGIIRNSKRLESLSPIAAANTILSPIDSTPMNELSKRASMQANQRAVSRRQSLTNLNLLKDDLHVKPPTTAAAASNDPNDAHKRYGSGAGAMIDYPPILSMVFDKRHCILYTSDDMGYLKGWKLRDILFEPHCTEYRSRGWNEFSSLKKKDQLPTKIHLGGLTHGLGFKRDDHELLSDKDIIRVFHPPPAPPANSSKTIQFKVTAADEFASSSKMFRLRPFLAIQAHNGACNGIQLIEADAGLQTRFDEEADPDETQTTAQSTTAPTPARCETPLKSILTKSQAHGPSLVNPINLGLRASLHASPASSKNTSRATSPHSSTLSSRAITPRDIVGERQQQRAAIARSSMSVKNEDEGKDKEKVLTKKELEAIEEAKIRRWEEQAFDEDSASDMSEDEDPERTKAKQALTAASTSRAKANTHRDIHDLPDHPRGQGRRVSVAMELTVKNQEAIKAYQQQLHKTPGHSKSNTSRRKAAASTAVSSPTPLPTSLSPGPPKLNAAASGPCLLTYGSDGCVHLFSILSHKRVGTLQQGFTVRNSKTTPSDWRYVYPIEARQLRDEGILQEMIRKVEESEELIRQQEWEKQLKRERYEEEIQKALTSLNLKSNGGSPARLKSPKNKRSGTGSRNSLKSSGSTPQLLLTDGQTTPIVEKRAESDEEPSEDAQAKALRAALSEESKDASTAAASSSSQPPPPVVSAEALEAARAKALQRKLDRQFSALEYNIRDVIRNEKRKQLRSAKSGELHVTSSVPPEQLKEIATQKAIVTSKSMSALTPSIYAQAGGQGLQQYSLSPSTSTTSLYSLPGVRPPPPPVTAPPSKRFSTLDYSSTWTDYDGTIRTYEDPLGYRFKVEDYLADVAQRHQEEKATAQQNPTDHSRSGSTLTVDTALAANVNNIRTPNFSPKTGSVSPGSSSFGPHTGTGTGGVDSDSASDSERKSSDRVGSSGRSPSNKTPKQRPSFSLRSPPNIPLQDEDMAALQRRALDRQRILQLEENRKLKKEKARSLAILQATLDREKQLKAQMSLENKKLSPRSAEMIRMRMLISRKPTRLLDSQLESVGMKLTEKPKPRKELNAFGELVTPTQPTTHYNHK